MKSFAARTELLWVLVALGLTLSTEAQNSPTYEIIHEPKVPCTLHVVKVPRDARRWEVQTVHAQGKALGLERLSSQLKRLEDTWVTGINGDYYVRRGVYAGDPRGLQIMRGELISAPAEGASFWIDALDQPNLGITSGQFEVVWPDGSSAPIALNETGNDRGFVLYTAAVGDTLKSRGGVNLVLERAGSSKWLPLRPGRIYSAKVQEQHKRKEVELSPETLVLSAGRRAKVPKLNADDLVRISTATQPSLRGVAEAISGGPILVLEGKRQRIKTSKSDSYVFSSMHERHPRSAIGWNEEFYFFVSVDGRKPGESEGLTLEEFGAHLVKLGCDNALNLDGGGSSTLWFEGKSINYLCDGYERKIANGLAIVSRKSAN